MKNLSLIALAAAIAAGLFVTDAAEARGGGERASFETLDTDGDGMITQAELDAQREARFAALDTNGDGQVTLDEFTASAQIRSAERAERMFSNLDADGDGTLSRDVIEMRGGPDGASLIERLDGDGDGAISEEEFEAMKSRRAEMRRNGGRPVNR